VYQSQLYPQIMEAGGTTPWTDEQWQTLLAIMDRHPFPTRLLREFTLDKRDQEMLGCSDAERLALLRTDVERYVEMFPEDVWECRQISESISAMAESVNIYANIQSETYLFLTQLCHFSEPGADMACQEDEATDGFPSFAMDGQFFSE
jgi:hypothetical protein